MDEFENIQGSLIPYNHEEIEIVLKQLLLNNGINDVMYEGSNVSQLASVISYVISSLNINTAINLQETILPLATKRMNVLFGARQLGYEPHSVKSFVYELTLKPMYDETKTTINPDGEEVVDTNDRTDRYISLIHNTKFIAGDKSYWYVGPTLYNVITVSNYDIQYINDPDKGRPASEILLKIPVVEGELTTYEDDPALQYTAYTYTTPDGKVKTKQDYLVPYKNVEEDYGLQVYLTYVDDEGYEVEGEEWTKAESFLIDETLSYNERKFIRKENIILGYPAIFFEYAGFGHTIRPGTQIRVNVLQSSGPDGMAEEEILIDDVSFSQEMEVIDQRIIEYGTNVESNEEIKENALVFHNTANRAVTRLDYVGITQRHPLVKEADAWGGEDEEQKQIGNIWISCTPAKRTRPIIEFDNGWAIDIGTPSKEPTSDLQLNWRNWYLTDEEYSELFEYLDVYKIVSMQLNHRQPLYINFDYKIDIVKYDISKSPKTVNLIAFSTIDTYFQEKLEKFDSEYLTSNIQRVLDVELGYSTGVNIELSLSGTLCEDMIDQYYLENFNRKDIIVSLSWPYETLLNPDNSLDLNKLPKIDTPDFGFNNGNLSVDYSKLNDDIHLPIRTAPIYYQRGSTVEIGRYLVNIRRHTIDIIFNFDWKIGSVDALTEIFGPSVNGSRSYQDFDISYYPHDKNTVNLPFSKHRIPRLRRVEFINN
jgi:hypothetical protein